MIALDAKQPNVRKFQAWCRENKYSCDVIPGRKVSSMAEAKPWLTSFGCFAVRNWKEGDFHIDAMGTVGCFLAHRDAWVECVRRGESVWIFEEGVYAYDSTQFVLLDRDYPTSDLILGHTVPVVRFWGQNCLERKTLGPGLASIDKVYFGTKCYRLSPKFAASLLENSRTFDIQVDTFLSLEAIRYEETFQVMRTTRNIVSAISSGKIQHSISRTLCTQIILIIFLVWIGIFLLCQYRSRRKFP